MAIKRCTHPFAASVDGQPMVFAADKLFDEEDPVYKGLNAEHKKAFFEDVATYTQRRLTSRQTETATAAPGESRNVTRRRGKAGDA